MNYLDSLRNTSKKLDAEFDGSKLINHNLSKGIVREQIIKKCIEPFLPKAYGISGGECFDQTGAVSKQLDAVVYDRLFSYAIPYGKDYFQFPFESVYGNIEIKSVLNKDELSAAIENIISFKRLTREKPPASQITPNRSINIGGITWENKDGYYEPFGVIFAFNSSEPDTIIDHLQEIQRDDLQYLPNLIVLYDKKTIIFRIKYELDPNGKKGWYVINQGDYDGFVAIPCGDDTLPIFIMEVLMYSSFERITAMSIPDIIDPVVDSLLHKGKEYKQVIYKSE